MDNCLITFRSVTPAQRGELTLRRAGISCAVRRTPRILADQGCGYSLQLDPADLQTGLQLLRSRGIPFRKAYRADPEGNLREIDL